MCKEGPGPRLHGDGLAGRGSGGRGGRPGGQVGLRDGGPHVAEVEEAQHAHDGIVGGLLEAPAGAHQLVQPPVHLAAPPELGRRRPRCQRRPPLRRPRRNLSDALQTQDSY